MRLIDADAVRRIAHSVHGDYSGYDFYDGVWWLLNRIKELPTIKLPPHGDLIDRDAFREENEYYLNREFINPKYDDTLDDLLKDAPVVIPAERSEK